MVGASTFVSSGDHSTKEREMMGYDGVQSQQRVDASQYSGTHSLAFSNLKVVIGCLGHNKEGFHVSILNNDRESVSAPEGYSGIQHSGPSMS